MLKWIPNTKTLQLNKSLQNKLINFYSKTYTLLRSCYIYCTAILAAKKQLDRVLVLLWFMAYVTMRYCYYDL